MAAPLYFLPQLTRAGLADHGVLRRSVLTARGLDEALADVTREEHTATVEVTAGPDRQSGLVLCALPGHARLPGRLGYYPAQQQWHAVGDGQLLWIGLALEEPVTPADLVRRRVQDGYQVPLDNGHEIAVPVVRREDGTTELPRALHFAAEVLVEEVKPQWRALWEATAPAAEWYFGVRGFDHESFSLAAAVALAVRGIAVNYRYDRALHNVLGWVDSTNWGTVLQVMVDMPRVLRLQLAAEAAAKKNESSPLS